MWIQTITSLPYLFHCELKHFLTYEAWAMLSIKLIGFNEQNMYNSPSGVTPMEVLVRMTLQEKRTQKRKAAGVFFWGGAFLCTAT